MRTAIVVPGNGAYGHDGAYRITPRCLRVVEEASRLAAELDPAAVVLTGWSPAGGACEAEQMRAAWRGPEVELVVEPTARSTAENASRTLPLLVARGVTRAVVVCTPMHRFRTAFFFRRLYEPAGIEVEIRTARVAPSLDAVLWELVAMTVRRAQLRAARRELE